MKVHTSEEMWLYDSMNPSWLYVFSSVVMFFLGFQISEHIFICQPGNFWKDNFQFGSDVV